MADFSNYNLSNDHVYELAEMLLPDMAVALGFQSDTSFSTEQELRDFIAHIGPAKTLQDNIGLVQERIGSNQDAVNIAADWVERSGVLEPVRRPFVAPGNIPEEIDSVVLTGGVANWILRRTAIAEQFDPEKVGKVVLVGSAREMGDGEHQLVRTLKKSEGKSPTEHSFMSNFVVPRLERAGLKTRLIRGQETDGDKVLDQAFAEVSDLIDDKVVVAANAPNAIQAAGQLRLAGKRAHRLFDTEGNQLYVVSDTIQVARKGEGPAIRQNSLTALGQIARNALFLHLNAMNL